MKIECSFIQFRVDIDFPEADVDMALAENWSSHTPLTPFAGTFTHKLRKGSATPRGESVALALDYLHGCARQISKNKWESTSHITPLPELEEMGVSVVSTYGLMQGCCHIEFEVAAEKFTSELVSKVTAFVGQVFKRFVRYYKN